MRPATPAAYARRDKRRARIVGALLAIDSCALLLAGGAASWVRFGSVSTAVAFRSAAFAPTFAELSVVALAPWLGAFAVKGLYDLERTRAGIGDLPKVFEALILGAAVLLLGSYALHLPGISRLWVVLAVLFAAVFVMVGRVGVQITLSVLRRTRRLSERTLVVGSNAEAADIVHMMRRNPAGGLVPVGCLASSHAERLTLDHIAGEVPCLGYAREVVAIVAREGIDTVVVAGSAFDHDVLARIVAELRDVPVTLHISSGLFDVLARRVLVNEVAGVPLITVKGAPLSEGRLLLKRAFDLVVASTIVLVGLPLWLAIAAAIALTSPGGVFYRQERVGRAGRTFLMLKFRTMYRDADARRDALARDNEASGPLFKMRDDPRVTPIGRWLRRLSLDEFPQVLNVLKGEMSLVGPRPPLACETAAYTTNDWRRLQVVPGMTGLWQVSGRSLLTFDEMVRLDLFYIENWSVGLDITLLARTIPAVLLARGAY